MINVIDKMFVLSTDNTTYAFRITETGHLEHLYYGEKIEADENALKEKIAFNPGNLLAYSKEYVQTGFENMSFEISTKGKSDIRLPFVSLINADGSMTNDFVFDKYEIVDKKPMKTLPSSYDENKNVKTLEVELVDKHNKLRLIIGYSIFEKCNVITRTAKLINEGSENIVIEKLMSCQLDLDENDYNFITFNGGWTDEMNKNVKPCQRGIMVNSSVTGTSSNRSNPFVILAKKETNEDYGECYGLNLVYSGNHYEAVEVNTFGKLRFVSGINPETFSYNLGAKQEFEAPEAVMTFSSKGFNDMSHNMHDFVREHIVRGKWKYKERPVLLNSWEAAYFDFNEEKLVDMAKAAADVGIELFVMDDGWFGERNSDNSSLGDWFVNTAKLPNGIKGLADKINALGLDFGIWVEPEMVNENSECYRKHPDWAVRIPGVSHSEGRNQMILDLTKKEVREYIVEEMSKVFVSANISYVKWDMNRIFSDYYSNGLNKNSQKEFSHRYVCGLYEVMDRLVKTFPDILFEGCSAGGNRFDLGILSYMPQIWGSDNTDAMCRANIQTGYSYGYPMSTVTSHVSSCPNHQTFRTTPLETRYVVAAFGVLGYECNLKNLSKDEYEDVKEQVACYKKIRKTMQFGDYYRIKNGEDSINAKGEYQWICVNEEKDEAVGAYVQSMVVPDQGYCKFKTKGLDEGKKYNFSTRKANFYSQKSGKIAGEKECYTVSGSLLNNAGIKLQQGFFGFGYNENVRWQEDFGGKMYIISQV